MSLRWTTSYQFLHRTAPSDRWRRANRLKVSRALAERQLDDARTRGLFTLAVTTGMRQGELLGLRWRDVDWATRRAFVRHTLVRLHGRWWLGEPKTARSERSIELTDATLDVLRAHRDRQAEMGATAGRRLTGDDLIFSDPVGEPLWAATSRPSPSRRCYAGPGCRRSACTTCATPSRRCS